jgi:CrcB protein
VTFLAVALGGAIGALLRWTLGEALPDGAGFPWTTFGINLTGSLVLASLPVLDAVRSRPRLAAGLGPGLLGGYTTLSSYAEETRALLADGQTLTALAYLLGTFAACLVAVTLVSRLYPPAAGDEFAAEGGDE